MEDPEFLESKRQVYGQYRPISSKKTEPDNIQISPRKAAVVKQPMMLTGSPPKNMELET